MAILRNLLVLGIPPPCSTGPPTHNNNNNNNNSNTIKSKSNNKSFNNDSNVEPNCSTSISEMAFATATPKSQHRLRTPSCPHSW